MPNGPHKITGEQCSEKIISSHEPLTDSFPFPGLPFDESLVKSDKSVQDEEIVKLLKTSANPKVERREIEAEDFFY